MGAHGANGVGCPVHTGLYLQCLALGLEWNGCLLNQHGSLQHRRKQSKTDMFRRRRPGDPCGDPAWRGADVTLRACAWPWVLLSKDTTDQVAHTTGTSFLMMVEAGESKAKVSAGLGFW